jgi:MoxR-like ATPase
LREHLATDARLYVSDRRWVKIVWLLRVAAASEGRGAIGLWDLLLLPWPDRTRCRARPPWPTGCGAPRRARGLRAGAPDARRAGLRGQLEAEQKANDLDYDDAGTAEIFAAEGVAGMAELADRSATPRAGRVRCA